MQQMSIEDEFVIKTLKKVPGCLGKLQYLSGLRDEHGELRHWGLEKTHGIEQSRDALQTVYTKLLHELLSTPLRELWQEMVDAGEKSDISPLDQSLALREAVLRTMPKTFGKAQRDHLRLVLDVICSFAERESWKTTA